MHFLAKGACPANHTEELLELGNRFYQGFWTETRVTFNDSIKRPNKEYAPFVEIDDGDSFLTGSQESEYIINYSTFSLI